MSPFTWDAECPPFSFLYDGKPSVGFLGKWERWEISEELQRGRLRHFSMTDPATGLSVVAHVKTFDDFPALDWVIELENRGTGDTPLIESILPLDVTRPESQDGPVLLHHANGSLCQVDDFLPQTSRVTDRRPVVLAPVGGRSSNGTSPFMNLQWNGGGTLLAVGWTGQWRAAFERSASGLRLSAGMERTHLRLHAGERIRTPRILCIDWEGDDPIAGNNLLRRIILAHYVPRADGDILLPPVAHNTQASFYRTGQVSEKGELDAIARAAELGIEAYWLDACWYGRVSPEVSWWQQVGDWRVRRDAFPNGLKPLGDAAHRAGMKFALWFEPERVRQEVPLASEHPEFLLRSAESQPHFGSGNLLLNLGLPEARAYITEQISGIIAESGVDIYRQDFNLDPLPYWQAADAADRVGMTEIRHIEGLYAMWDALRSRHPGLAIDNCSSGGRRIDLETLSRSFPLWRSDFSDYDGPSHGSWLQIADQVQTAGLSRWIPLHAGPVWHFTPYDFRSAMAAGVVPYSDIRGPEFPQAAAREAIAELKSLRPCFLGDFYPLMPLTAAAHDWCACQYDRPDLGEGFAVFLRRHESPFSRMEVLLRGIDLCAVYEVSKSPTFVEAARERMNGAELAKMTVMIDDRPGSILLRYHRV